ncbi:purine catabolism regulatory protein [Enterococcus florum]|uniref:Purine catabolism regulatory protein n=1 Tax=Enterococcus florum TaxID=2480627 RepID=A0A4P5P587_9ENTE|nr:PucR family transcriptional regulator [Enterococcus florum]GCF92596.1 purine catabolism regulatory protein [Enterococcus florum]
MNVNDLLKIPSMKGASVLAGKNQLDRLVTTVSVLEVSEPDAYSKMPIKGEYSGNEFVITSFAQVADNVEKQLEIVSILHQHSQLGIILYYVGIIMPEVSPQLIKRMDELQMILIVMPRSRMELRYSEVISEVLTYVNEEEAQIENQQDILIETIRNLPQQQHQIETGLSILSDKLKCSLFLLNEEQEILLSKSWPRSLDAHLRAWFQRSTQITQKNAVIEMQQMVYFYTKTRLNLPSLAQKYTLAIFRKDPLSDSQLSSLQTMTEKMIKFFGEDQLLNTGQQFFFACQTGDFSTAALLAKKAGVELTQPFDFYCFRNHLGDSRLKEWVTVHSNSLYYQEAKFEWLIGNTIREPEERPLLIRQPSEFLFEAKSIPSLSLVQKNMQLIEEYLPALTRVFPGKTRFIPEDLTLLSDVSREFNPIEFDSYLEKEMIHTLAAYFLDHDESINRTAKALFLHNNTIKYRIKRAQELLKMSFVHTSSRYLLVKSLIYFRKYH